MGNGVGGGGGVTVGARAEIVCLVFFSTPLLLVFAC